MRLPGAKSEPQRLARPEEVGLAYDFIERARAELLGKRCVRLPLCEKIIH
jgi:hypothetical protein